MERADSGRQYADLLKPRVHRTGPSFRTATITKPSARLALGEPQRLIMTQYKLLITTSGVGSRLGDLTRHTNKALIKVGGKPVISHIIDTYPTDIDIVVTLGYKAELVREFLTSS